MSPKEPQDIDHSASRRRELQWDAALGFSGFFAVLAVIQAVLNLLQPEPALWPAILALVMVVWQTSLWRYTRSKK